MRQTYGDDEGGYRGWGPTSNNKRPGWMPAGGNTGELAAAGAVGAAAGGAAGYYSNQHGNNYEPYGQPAGDDYYYPDEHGGGGPPEIPPKSYERYSDPAAAEGYGSPSNEYPAGAAGATLAPAQADVERHPSNASSRYSTVSTDENAGRSYQSSPRFQQNSGSPPPSGGRLGRSTMGAGDVDYGEEHGGRYDAVNF